MNVRNLILVMSSLTLAQTALAVKTPKFVDGPIEIGKCYGEPLVNGVCDRQPVFQRMIISRVKERIYARGSDVATCDKVTREDLCTITEMDPYYTQDEMFSGQYMQKKDDGYDKFVKEGLETVHRNDLEGLYKVRILRIMFAGLKRLDPDAFEGMRKPEADDCYPYNPDEGKVGSINYKARAKAKDLGYSAPHTKNTDNRHDYPTGKDKASCVAYFDIGHNEFEGPIPGEVFAPLTNVDHLEMDTNLTMKLGLMPVNLFKGLTKLRELDMDQTGLTGIPDGSFATNVSLESVDFKDCPGLTSLPADLLSNVGRAKGAIEINSVSAADEAEWRRTYGVAFPVVGLH